MGLGRRAHAVDQPQTTGVEELLAAFIWVPKRGAVITRVQELRLELDVPLPGSRQAGKAGPASKI